MPSEDKVGAVLPRVTGLTEGEVTAKDFFPRLKFLDSKDGKDLFPRVKALR